MTLNSFEGDVEAVVVGASGGIGQAFCRALDADPGVNRVYAYSRTVQRRDSPKIASHIMDLSDEQSIIDAASRLRQASDRIRLVIAATGVLHDGRQLQPEKSWEQIRAASMAQSFAINATGPALLASHFLPLFPRRGRAVFAVLSARVGSISDNRLGGWIAYRASKAALNMIVQTLSIELRRRRPDAIIVGLHPGTVDTALSAPFQANVPAGGLQTPDEAVDKLLSVIDALGPADSGQLLAYDGSAIPR